MVKKQETDRVLELKTGFSAQVNQFFVSHHSWPMVGWANGTWVQSKRSCVLGLVPFLFRGADSMSGHGEDHIGFYQPLQTRFWHSKFWMICHMVTSIQFFHGDLVKWVDHPNKVEEIHRRPPLFGLHPSPPGEDGPCGQGDTGWVVEAKSLILRDSMGGASDQRLHRSSSQAHAEGQHLAHALMAVCET